MKTIYKILIVVVAVAGFAAATLVQQALLDYQAQVKDHDEIAKRQELAQNGVVLYDSSGPGKNIVDYSLNTNNGTYTIDEGLEKTIRQKQDELSHNIESIMPNLRTIADTNSAPLTHIGLSYKWKALEIGIEVPYADEQKMPQYFTEFRKIVGDDVDIVIVTSTKIKPVDSLQISVGR